MPTLLRSLLTIALIGDTSLASDLPAWALGPFERPQQAAPVIKPEPLPEFPCPMRHAPVHWEFYHTFNPAAVLKDGHIQLLYRAEDNSGPMHIGGHTSRIGLASSDDGISFKCEATPILFPAEDSQKDFEWDGGCEDPRIATSPDGTWVLTYTQYNKKSVRLGMATSKDLKTWEKLGSAFAGTKYENLGTKSASVLHEIRNGHLVAAKVRGTYWMYFGEQEVNAATSPDLVHWTPVESEPGKLLAVMKPRDGRFDSSLTEVGPPMILTPKGIILIYNGKNSTDDKRDPALSGGVYTCGQALFDKDEPTRLIERLDTPFFKPELPWEKSGQYVAGTTFAEGLLFRNGRWFLYYGCADTFVGVAEAKAQ